MAGLGRVKALLFDVFGTVVDWRGALLAEGEALARAKGVSVDWPRFIAAWESARRPAMDRVNAGEIPWTNVSEIYRRRLDEVLPGFGLESMDEPEREHFNRVWCRPNPWPDTLPALARLGRKFVLATLTNNDFAWAVAMAKHARLPWDCILTAELFRRYKPAPETYRGALALLAVRPEEAMMVASHNYDLRAAQAQGLRTAFFPRKEHGEGQTRDQAPEGAWDIVTGDLSELADRLGA
ncbi:MAG: haloacid dehalogenase, type II [Betaproteobacteria bacterium RIFCSPLOWO2_12_FULL_68_20]|nr:MAG: haloacid dehalogenase, type II [Betaproteobacteria bacterium RIFCSPLOWO2_12_FULL_68_20]